MLLKLTICYNCSAISFAFKMVSEGGRGSLLDAYAYLSIRKNTLPSSSANLRTDTITFLCVCLQTLEQNVHVQLPASHRFFSQPPHSVLSWDVSFTWISWMIWLSQLNAAVSNPRAACGQSRVLCGSVEVFAVVIVSWILTSCPYFDNH